MDSAARVAKKIKELRLEYQPGGLSQEDLANALDVQTNTISRWETGIYKPKLKDLDRLAEFFGISISDFFVDEEINYQEINKPLNALMRAAKDLHPDDVDVLRQFAELRRAQKKSKK